MGDARSRSWYLTRKEIERGSPSRRDGVGAAREAELRTTYCSFIRDVCIRLRLPQVTTATAIMLCHRFYLRQSLVRNEWQTIATVCVFLASKVEDTPCQLQHVATVAYETMYYKNPNAAKRIHQDEVLAKQKGLILVGETLLLSTIGFDFNIQHPYEPLKLALMNLKINQKEVRQFAVNIINDTLPTDLVVRFKPHYIAAGSLFLAAKFHNIRLSVTGKIWWQEFDVAPKQLQVVVEQMKELFKKRYPHSMSPAIEPTATPTLMDKQQIIRAPSPAVEPPPTPALMDKQQASGNPDPALRHSQSSRRRISMVEPPPTPALVDKQQLTGNPGPAPWHSQSSRRRIGNGDNTVACRRLHVDNSSYNKPICCSARNEQNQSLEIVAVDQRTQKQCSWGTLKADHVYHTGPKDMDVASIRDVNRQKRRNQEVGGYPAPDDIADKGAWVGRQLRTVTIVVETNSSWKRQKVERG